MNPGNGEACSSASRPSRGERMIIRGRYAVEALGDGVSITWASRPAVRPFDRSMRRNVTAGLFCLASLTACTPLRNESARDSGSDAQGSDGAAGVGGDRGSVGGASGAAGGTSGVSGTAGAAGISGTAGGSYPEAPGAGPASEVLRVQQAHRAAGGTARAGLEDPAEGRDAAG